MTVLSISVKKRWSMHWYLKEQYHEIFDFRFFSWINFPPAPEYPIRTVSNYFENSWRYSQLKVHHWCCWHWWQIKKIFYQKIFFLHLWVVDSTYRLILFFKLTLSCQQFYSVPIICHWCCWHRQQITPLVSLKPAANLLPVSMKPVANLPQYHQHYR